MGYNTDFQGQFKLNKPLTHELRYELEKFAATRHNETEFPGFWCQWVPNFDGTAIEWDESEKFYNYIDWIKYLIDNFLKKDNYILNGIVMWRGEDFDDNGTITITDNKVSTKGLI